MKHEALFLIPNFSGAEDWYLALFSQLHAHIAKTYKKIYSQYMIAETVIEALIAETVHGFNENDECFSKSRDVFSARMQSYIKTVMGHWNN